MPNDRLICFMKKCVLEKGERQHSVDDKPEKNITEIDNEVGVELLL